MDLKSNDWLLQRNGEGDLTQRHTEEKGHVKMELEMGMMHLQGKKHDELLATTEARREAWDRFFLRDFGRNQSRRHFNFGLPASGINLLF